MKIGALQFTATAFDEARDGAACAAAVLRAIDGDLRRGQGGRIDLDYAETGADALEMVAAIAVGDGETAVLHHHADAADALRCVGIDATAAGGDPPDDDDPIAQRIAPDSDVGVGDIADGAAIIAGCCDVIGVSGPRICSDFGDISQDSARTGGERGHRDRKSPPVARNRCRNEHAIVADRRRSQPYCVRQIVLDGQRPGRAPSVAVEHINAVLHRLSGHDDRRTGLFPQCQRGSGAVDGDIDAHRCRR